jgi:hypothetical protein
MCEPWASPLPTGQDWELELNCLVKFSSLAMLLVSGPNQFLQGDWMYCYLCRLDQGCVRPCPTQIGSVQHFIKTAMGWITLPPPGRTGDFSPFIRPTALSRRGAICLQAVLDYVVSGFHQSRWCDMLIWMDCNFSQWYCGVVAQVTGSPQSEVLHLQILVGPDNPGNFRTCSAILCIEFLLFGEIEEKR